MQQQKAKDTKLELDLRRELHRRGLRYFVHRRPLPSLRRVADIVFPKARVAVFACGCFWHGHDHAMRNRRWDTNAWYWPDKIERNRQRDSDTDARLASAGWISIRIWECDDPAEAAASVAALVSERRSSST